MTRMEFIRFAKLNPGQSVTGLAVRSAEYQIREVMPFIEEVNKKIHLFVNEPDVMTLHARLTSEVVELNQFISENT